MGASHAHELLAQAKEYGYSSLALTDTNLCGALEFARLANSLGIRPITGGELTLTDDSRITLLAKTRTGYSNISRLFTLANAADRRKPRLDPAYLPDHSEGVVLLTGGRHGQLSRLTTDGRRGEARELLKRYMDWYGPGAVYVELNRNFLQGDAKRNRELAGLARETGVPIVASNDVHYHTPERSRLHDALVAARLNTTIDQALPHLLPNHNFALKSQAGMERLFAELPEAVSNTLRVAETCSFDLSADLDYSLPDPDVPDGYTPTSYLERLCYEAAMRRYGGVSERVEARLREEFHLIEAQGLAGFLLLYREIALIARRIMEERGMVRPETPVEERPPGRGRGSSVALLVGYLIGISHVDPLEWDLTLERFISEGRDHPPRYRPRFPKRPQGRAHRACAPPLRAGVRRPDRGSLHLQAQGDHPRPRQGPGTSAGGAKAPVQAGRVPQSRTPPAGDAGASRLPGQGECQRLEGADRACSPVGERPQDAGPARRGHDPQQFAHTGDGPHAG